MYCSRNGQRGIAGWIFKLSCLEVTRRLRAFSAMALFAAVATSGCMPINPSEDEEEVTNILDLTDERIPMLAPVHGQRITPGGTQLNEGAGAAVISQDGRYVLFETDATNIDEDHTYEGRKLVLYDIDGDAWDVVSRMGSPCWDGDFFSLAPSGRTVVYHAHHEDSIRNDRDEYIVMWDRESNQHAEWLMNGLGIGGGPYDIRQALFDEDRLFVVVGHHAWQPHAVVEIPSATVECEFSAPSPFILTSDVERIVFGTDEPLAGDDTNNRDDLYVRDLSTNHDDRVTVGPNGSESEGRVFVEREFSVSPNGRYVAFAVRAKHWDREVCDECDGIWVRDLVEERTWQVGAVVNDQPLLTNSHPLLGFVDESHLVVDLTELHGLVVIDILSGEKFRLPHAQNELGYLNVTCVAPNPHGERLSARATFMSITSRRVRLILRDKSGFGYDDPADTNGRRDLYFVDFER